MNIRPTPETDAFAIKFQTPCGEKYWVPVDIARRLESERDEAIFDLDFRRRLGDWQNKTIDLLARERDEARGQLAEIEDKMRVELGGHPDSELWGEAGLIAATMRCVDALGEVTDQLDEARGQRDKLVEQHNKNAINFNELLELCGELRKVSRAASVLIAAKGRHNTMLAYNGLRDALQSLTPNETPSK